MGIGVQIARAIEATGKSGADLARFLGISESAVSQWISQATRPRISRLPDIAGFFGTTVAWLLSGDPWLTTASPRGFAEASAPFAEELEDELSEIIERLEKVRERLSGPARKRQRKKRED